MHITGINKNLQFKSRVIYEDALEPLSSFAKNYIDRFEEGYASDYKFLGEGVTSKAYYSQTNNFVIKQNKRNDYIPEKRRYEMGSLGHENNILQQISPKVKSTQRSVGYVETEKGGKFLLSTFVSGSPANSYTNPFYPKHIDRLLRNLYRLDKSMIIHSDLSRPNLLLDNDNNVNLIDYQWADKYKLELYNSNFGLNNSAFASFESPNNASMFESAALAGYSRSMLEYEAKNFLNDYYANKAHYTNKNVHRLEKKGLFSMGLTPMIEFEKARTKAYNRMDGYILDAEILKMNLLNLHRRQFSCHDINKINPRNILRTIPLQIRAKECADALANFSGGYDTDSTYFSYMRKFGQFWQSNIEKWYIPTLDFIFKLVSGDEYDPARIYFPETFNDFSGLDIINIGKSQTRKFSSEEKQLKNLFLSAHKNKYCVSYSLKEDASRLIRYIFKKR